VFVETIRFTDSEFQAVLIFTNVYTEHKQDSCSLMRLFLFLSNRRLESVKKRLDKDSLDKHSALRIDNYCHGLNNYSSGLGYHKFAVEMDPK
jgi:hypothetical protein